MQAKHIRFHEHRNTHTYTRTHEYVFIYIKEIIPYVIKGDVTT